MRRWIANPFSPSNPMYHSQQHWFTQPTRDCRSIWGFLFICSGKWQLSCYTHWPRLTTASYSTTKFVLKEVAKLTMKTRMGRHRRPESVTSAVFSLGETDISVLLANFFNLFVQYCTFRLRWKTSVISPVHKSDISYDPAIADWDYSHHPINDTSSVSIFMELLIKGCLITYLLNH